MHEGILKALKLIREGNNDIRLRKFEVINADGKVIDTVTTDASTSMKESKVNASKKVKAKYGADSSFLKIKFKEEYIPSE